MVCLADGTLFSTFYGRALSSTLHSLSFVLQAGIFTTGRAGSLDCHVRRSVGLEWRTVRLCGTSARIDLF